MIEQFTPNAEIWTLFDAACGDSLDADQVERLDAALRDDDRLRDLYLDYFRLHAELLRSARLERARENIIKSMHRPAPPAVPSIVLDLSSPLPSPLAASHYPQTPTFVGGPVFSYMVATLILGMMLLGAWAYTVTHDHDSFAENSRGQTAPGRADRERPIFESAGRITGMNDCRWSDPDTVTYLGSSVPLNRKYALSTGLLEITYDSGAKVILEGPCTYKVESQAGGYLELGKLTVRIEKKGREGEGEKGRLANSTIQSPRLPVSPSPVLFAVRTPTAVVTDLGTEFGVEVGEKGRCDVQVFQGVVEAVPLREGRFAGKPQRIVAGQLGSVRADADGGEVIVSAAAADSKRFVRELPAPLFCKHQIGSVGEFTVAGDDLIAAGCSTLSKIELTSGKAIQSGGVEKLNDGGVYDDRPEGNTEATFTSSDGAVVTIELNTALHPRGYNVKSVVVLTGSGGLARGQRRSSQKYDLAYSTAEAPDVYIPVRCDNGATVDRDAHGWPEMQTRLSGAGNNPIARGAAKLRLTFHDTSSPEPESMYREIDVFGSPVSTENDEPRKERGRGQKELPSEERR